MTKQQRELMRQIAEVKAEAAKISKLLGPDLCRVVVLRWPSLKDRDERPGCTSQPNH